MRDILTAKAMAVRPVQETRRHGMTAGRAHERALLVGCGGNGLRGRERQRGAASLAERRRHEGAVDAGAGSGERRGCGGLVALFQDPLAVPLDSQERVGEGDDALVFDG